MGLEHPGHSPGGSTVRIRYSPPSSTNASAMVDCHQLRLLIMFFDILKENTLDTERRVM